MLSVVTPATSMRLTTLERAREMLGFGYGDYDAAERCIDSASRTIADHCRRPFGLATYRETFRGADLPDGALLSRGPVTAFVSVTSDDTVLAAEEYSFDPDLGRLYRTDLAGLVWRWWGSALTVVYSAGYTLPADTGTWTLPDPVERACILLAGAYLSQRDRDPLIRTESVEGVGSTTWWVPGGSGLPSQEAEQLLQPYRRLA